MTQMKDSGVEWIGNVPNSWSMCKGKYLFAHSKQVVGKDALNYERLALTLNGVIKRSKEDDNGLQPSDFEAYQILEKNQLVFKLIDLNNVSTSRVGLSPYTGIVSPAYIVLSAVKNINPSFAEKYFLMLWHQKIFNQLGDAGVRSSINASDLLDIFVPLPDLREQEQIVAFLDERKCAIDRLIDNLNKQIESLKDYKKEIISEAVTKGLDPNVPLKDSGVEWLGSVPESWEIVKGKFVFKLLNRPTRDTDDVITCFRDGEVTLRSKRREEGFTMADFEYGYQGIEKGDLVVHGMDGFAGAVGISDSRGKGSPVLNVLDTNNDKRYMMYYFRGLAYRNVFVGLSTGIRVRSCDLHWKKIGNLCFLVPPISEQNHISEYLDEKCKQINQLIIVKQRTIDKLNEYSKSLIYEYVTGKKEVV